MKLLIATAAVGITLGLFLSANPVWSAPMTPRAVVSYGELNLSRDAGARELIRRIEFAATRVCGGKPAAGNPAAWHAYRTCRNGAIARAVSDINHPMVYKAYGAQG